MTPRERLQRNESQLQKVRLQAISLVLGGASAAEVSEKLGVSRGSIFNWLARHKEGGALALATRPRSGRPRKLDDEELLAICEMIVKTDQIEPGCHRSLWNQQMIFELVRERTQGEISRWSISRLLGYLGLAPQRSNFRAWKMDPDDTRRWASRQFPPLNAYARRISSRIFFVDEAKITADSPIGRTWVKLREGSFSRDESACTMISAIPPSGSLRFMVSNPTLSSGSYRKFLDRLMAHEERQVILIADHNSALATGVIRRFIRKFEGRLLLYVIPSHDPKLNPYEHVRGWTKSLSGESLERSEMPGNH